MAKRAFIILITAHFNPKPHRGPTGAPPGRAPRAQEKTPQPVVGLGGFTRRFAALRGASRWEVRSAIRLRPR